MKYYKYLLDWDLVGAGTRYVEAEDGVKQARRERVGRSGGDGWRSQGSAVAQECADRQIARIHVERSVDDPARIILERRDDVIQSFTHVSEGVAAANHHLTAAAHDATEPPVLKVRTPGHAEAGREVVVIGVIQLLALAELRQAEAAFSEVERLERGDGALNMARVQIREGRLDDAATSLERAANAKNPAYPWSITWFTGLVNKQNGRLDAAIRNLKDVIATNFAEARKREFDFSKDYTALDELGQTLMERAKEERGPDRRAQREKILREAASWFEKTLTFDSEDLAAHYNLALIYGDLGDGKRAADERALYTRYKPDDNARDTTVALHRMRNPAANHAAEPVVIYDLQREGRYTSDVGPILKAEVHIAADESDERPRTGSR